MDTPGHVDFGYEVSRSLSACEGSLLVVDASQGVEAQTLANVYQAIEADHEIVPVLNKIDLPAAEPDRIKAQIEEVVGLPADGAIAASAKTGAGMAEILEALVTQLPAPSGDREVPLKALLVDSWYDAYLGVMTLVRVRDGVLKKGMKIRMIGTGATHVVERVSVFSPKPTRVDELGPGEIGFINAGVKTVSDIRSVIPLLRSGACVMRHYRDSRPQCRWFSVACFLSIPMNFQHSGKRLKNYH